jgi:hypothetical protein
MSKNLRHGRTLFALFIGVAFFIVAGWLPMVTAQTERSQNGAAGATQQQPIATSTPVKPEPVHPDFHQADRNKDGKVDKSEAGVVPGLSANFERADRDRNGFLDEAEFGKGLEILQVRR